MNVPGNDPAGTGDRADRRRAEEIRRLAARLSEGLLPDITDDEADDRSGRDEQQRLRWLTENRPPHHDR